MKFAKLEKAALLLTALLLLGCSDSEKRAAMRRTFENIDGRDFKLVCLVGPNSAASNAGWVVKEAWRCDPKFNIEKRNDIYWPNAVLFPPDDPRNKAKEWVACWRTGDGSMYPVENGCVLEIPFKQFKRHIQEKNREDQLPGSAKTEKVRR